MSAIVKLANPFHRNTREIIQVKPNQTIFSLRNLPDIVKDFPFDLDILAILNGKKILKEDWDSCVVFENDFLFFVPDIRGGGQEGGDTGKAILNVAAMIGITLIAGPASTALWGVKTGVGVALTKVAFVVGGALAIAALTPEPQMPVTPNPSALDTEQSQSFGWNPVTTQRQGIIVPRWYGLNRVEGNIVSVHTEEEDATFNESTIADTYYYFRTRTSLLRNKSILEKTARPLGSRRQLHPEKVTLYTMFDTGVGPIREPVVPDTLEINGAPIKTYKKAYYEKRNGQLRQKVVSYFNPLKVEVPVGRLVKHNRPVIYETKNGNFNNLEIELTFPNGLFNGSGSNLASYTVNVTIEIKSVEEAAWTKLLDAADISAALGNIVIETYFTDGNYAIEYGKNYQIRVRKNTADRNSYKYGDNLYLSTVRELIEIGFTRPRRASVSTKIQATDQLSNSIGFSCVSRGLFIVDFRISADEIVYSNNPALVIRDILTQPVLSGASSPWYDLQLMLYLEGADTATETVDDSPIGNEITFGGTAQLATGAYKFSPSSLLLDGNSDYLVIDNKGEYFNLLENLVEDWTIDLFVKHVDHAGTEYYLTLREDTDNRWVLVHDNGGGLIFRSYKSSSLKIEIANVGEITDTNWHHIALCKVGTAIGLYKDGTQVGYDTMISTDCDVLDGNLYIGQRGSAESYFRGNFDHIRIIKSNIFNAAPVVGLTDTIVEPTENYSDPGHSFAIERYDGYDPLKLNYNDFTELADWCDDIRINPVNAVIEDISLAKHAIIETFGNHQLTVGDTIVFRNVAAGGMEELTDETTAIVLSVTSETKFMIDLDTSGYSAYTTLAPKLLIHCDGAYGSTDFTDEMGVHTIINNGVVIAPNGARHIKFGTGSALFVPTYDDHLRIADHADWDIFAADDENWTVDLFFYPWVNGIPNRQILICQFEDTNNYWYIGFTPTVAGDFYSIQFRIRLVTAGSAVVSITETIVVGPILQFIKMHHLALCKVGTKYGLYFDGVQVGYTNDTSNDTFAGDLYIGTLGTTGNYSFWGEMDEICIIDKNRFSASPNVGLTDEITVPGNPVNLAGGTIEKIRHRFEFNGGFDTESTMWDAALRVCELCRCVPYWSGGQVHLAIDKAADSVYAFTMGNIVKGSFKELYIPLLERASELEIQYKDANKNFERTSFTLINPNMTTITKKGRMDLFGINDEWMANYLADFKLLQNEYLKKMVSWTTEVEALPLIIGDVVDFQHDVSNYGEMGSGDDDLTGGGRVISATNVVNAVVVVDGKVEFDDYDWESSGMTNYKLLIKSGTDAPPESLTIVDCIENVIHPGYYDITVDGLYSFNVAEGDIWAIGKTNYETRKYRIIDLKTNSNQQTDITAIDYAPQIYIND